MALTWDVVSPVASAHALGLERKLRALSSQWGVEFRGLGVTVLVADKSCALSTYPLTGGAGLVIGEIFARQRDSRSDAAVRHAAFGQFETHAVLKSQGRSLLGAYWGNYVALLVDAEAQRRWLVNDPTGTLPCYFTEYHGIRIIFSCLSDCLALGLRFSVNWSFVYRRTTNGAFEVETPALIEVSTVHRGECVQLDRHGTIVSRSFYWHPSSFAESDAMLEDRDAAEETLRATVRSSVRSLALHHSSILQETSGGLDSSIVLGCLSDAPSQPEITCYTGYVADSVCDERRWARQAAQLGGHRHVELPFDVDKLDFRHMPGLAPSVEPASCLYHWQKGPEERALAGEYGASAAFTGQGGDSSFCSTSYIFSVDHSLRRHGLGLRTLHTAAQVAIRRDRTVWDVLVKALQRRACGTRMSDQRRLLVEGMRLVSENAVRSASATEHFPNPWFHSDSRVPLECIARLGALAFHPGFYDLSASHGATAPYSISPLYAQPVFEVCARIPVDVHFDGGHVRGLARRAFAREVPATILRRQWKDRPLRLAGRIVQRNIRFIREALLDGALVKERILDRTAVELALRGDPTQSNATGGEILRHLDLELWLRQPS